MIDTHCHLTFPDFHDPAFPGGAAAVLAEGARHGVTGCITISTTTRDCLEALAIAKGHERVWCTSGVHPLYSDDEPHQWQNLRIVAEDAKCVAWGELGLDNHYPEPKKDVQRRVLDEQLAFIEGCHKAWATAGAGRIAGGAASGKIGSGGASLPIVLHCREAFSDLIPILKKTSLDPTRFVFHCFTGTRDDMKLLLDFGGRVSFTGVVTYKNAAEVREAVKLVPADRIMVETDAPFLSPDPHRGIRPCQSWMASVTAQKLAEIRGEAWEAFHEQINENTARFFGVR